MSGAEAELIFFGMVFVVVFILAQSFVLPAFGENRKTQKRLRRRLKTFAAARRPEAQSLLRTRYADGQGVGATLLRVLPGGRGLESTLERAGWSMRPGTFLALAAGLALLGALLAWTFTEQWWYAAAGLLGWFLPFLKARADRRKRLNRFEEQLPDAIGIMTRGLRAGHPLAETLHLVSEELNDPAGTEFGRTFSDINYGGDVREAFLAMLERMPSVTVMAMVTGVLVQRETGGNLAEILDKLAGVVRGRFRFQRRVKTLSAEGRLSAWILALVPFVLFLVISVVSPDYMPRLIADPFGVKLIGVTFVLMLIGIIWISRIIRIEV